MRLTLNEKPVINIGTTTPSICEGETYSFAGATVTNQTSVLWSTDGDGIFDPSNSDVDATYIPGTNDRIVGNVRLVLKALSNQGCTDVEEEVFLTINSAPEISLSANTISVCA